MKKKRKGKERKKKKKDLTFSIYCWERGKKKKGKKEKKKRRRIERNKERSLDREPAGKESRVSSQGDTGIGRG